MNFCTKPSVHEVSVVRTRGSLNAGTANGRFYCTRYKYINLTTLEEKIPGKVRVQSTLHIPTDAAGPLVEPPSSDGERKVTINLCTSLDPSPPLPLTCHT